MVRIVKKPEERRMEILFAAKKIFLQQGYESTAMKDIMDELKIAKGTIYHYFQSKEELFESVVEQIANEYLIHLQTELDKIEGSALEKFQSLITAGNVAKEQAEFLDKLHRCGNIAMHTRLLAVTISKIAPLYAEIIKQGCQEGVFKATHPLESAEFLLAGIQFMTDLGSFPWSQTVILRRTAAISAVMEAQLGAPKGSFQFFTYRRKR